MKKNYIYIVRVYGDCTNGLIADADRVALGEWLPQHDGQILLCHTKAEAYAKAQELNAQYQRNGCYWYDVVNKEEKSFNFA